MSSSSEARAAAIIDVQNVWEVFSRGRDLKIFGGSVQKAVVDIKAKHPAIDWVIKPVKT